MADRPTRNGFTLLEVMVSMAILSVSLVAILNLHSGSVRVHNHTKHLTVATFLARSKMIDIEEDLLDEGLPEFNERKQGNFSEEGYPGYTWSMEVVKPKLGLDAAALQGMMGDAAGFLGGGGDAAGGAMGGIEAMAGGMEGLIMGQLQNLLDTLENSVREVRLIVGWSDITGPSQFSVVTHVVRLEGQGAPGGAEDRARDELRRAAEGMPQVPDIRSILPLPGGGRMAPSLNIERRLPAVPMEGGRR